MKEMVSDRGTTVEIENIFEGMIYMPYLIPDESYKQLILHYSYDIVVLKNEMFLSASKY